jgi:glycosyltransferase involved in cell wall biosynthesis
MKIIMFTDAYWPRVNGVTVSVDSFARALIKAGHKVMIVCSDYPQMDDGRFSGPDEDDAEDGPVIVRVPSMPTIVSKEDRIARLTKFTWVFKQAEAFVPDILHINSEFMLAEFGFLYGRFYNLPVIYTFHTLWEDYASTYFPVLPLFLSRFIIRVILKNVLYRPYKIIVPTPQIREVAARKYKVKQELFLLPTGIDADFFKHDKKESGEFRKKIEKKYPALKGKRILLFAGRVAREKNISFLLHLLPDVLKIHPDVILLIVGNGPDLDEFRKEADDLAVAEHCVFTGYLPRKDLALCYTISEIFVFPSLTETQGLVTLEAMLSGTPVVAIGEMGTIMVMGGDNGGFMVKNDPAEFTGRVLELLGDVDLRRRKSEEARQQARAWSIEELTVKLVDIYQNTIDAYRQEHGAPWIPVWELLTDRRWWRWMGKKWWKWTDAKWRKLIGWER